MMCKHHKVVLYISILSAVVSVSEQALLAMPTQYTPEAQGWMPAQPALRYQSWSLNSHPYFLTQVS